MRLMFSLVSVIGPSRRSAACCCLEEATPIRRRPGHVWEGDAAWPRTGDATRPGLLRVTAQSWTPSKPAAPRAKLMIALSNAIITSDFSSAMRMPAKPQAATVATAYSAVAAPRSDGVPRRRPMDTSALVMSNLLVCRLVCPGRLTDKVPSSEPLAGKEFRPWGQLTIHLGEVIGLPR